MNMPTTPNTASAPTHGRGDIERSAQTTRLLLAGGVVGPALFIIVYTLEDATRPGYDPWHQPVSALSLSGWGWEQIANFLLCGVLVTGFAIGLRRSLRALTAVGRGPIWGPLLIAVVGVALIVAGVFVTNPAMGYPPGTPDGPAVTPTLHGTIHGFAGLIVFGVLPIACYVMAPYFAGRAGWRGWALYSVATGIAMWGCFAGLIVAGMLGGPGGLYERLAICAGFIWLAILAARLLIRTRDETTDRVR
jgi:hypothetical protein